MKGNFVNFLFSFQCSCRCIHHHILPTFFRSSSHIHLASSDLCSLLGDGEFNDGDERERRCEIWLREPRGRER